MHSIIMQLSYYTVFIYTVVSNIPYSTSEQIPVVITTWNFPEATTAAWTSLTVDNSSSLEAVVVAGEFCEFMQCGGSVGYGNKPDENGETTLDAMVMDGLTMDAGAVGMLRNVKNAIGVAHAVLKYTDHTMLVGELATDFAASMGFPLESLSTNDSLSQWEDWKNDNCQPNFWTNVLPDPSQSCGPYTPADELSELANILQTNHHNAQHKSSNKGKLKQMTGDKDNHDTISIIVIDEEGNVASGTSTNGLRHKIAGRVGDSPVVVSGAYADNEVGAAVATGNGDVMMRFVPSYHAVESMRSGSSPFSAAALAIGRIAKFYPNFSGAVIAVNIAGEYGAACHNQASGSFPFTIMSPQYNETQYLTVPCTE